MRIRKPIATNPLDLPVEVSMLFEKAAFAPVRVPEAGNSFESFNKARNARLVLAKLKAQVLRSPECPVKWRSQIGTVQFDPPSQDTDGWCFYIKPFAGVAASLARGVVGEPVPSDQFWETYK